MILDSVAKKLEIILAGAVTANQLPFSASWEDITTTTFIPGETDGVTNNATAVDLVGVPGGSTQRRVKTINIYNADTAAATITVRYNNNSTLRVLIKVVLQVGEILLWDGRWRILDATGSQKTAQSGTGRWLKTTVLVAGTQFTTGPQTTTIFVRLQAGGGGGGGATFVTPNMGFGGGGAGGGYAEKTFTVTPNTNYTYVIGAAGTAGANTGGTGGTGGDTTFAVGATTVTAKGGLGGVGQIGAATLAAVLGGASGGISTNGDLNDAGMPGNRGIRLSGVLGGSGEGGSSMFGAGGVAKNTNSAGAAGLGYGAGGGGAAAVSANQAGGVGTIGCIVVDEYA